MSSTNHAFGPNAPEPAFDLSADPFDWCPSRLPSIPLQPTGALGTGALLTGARRGWVSVLTVALPHTGVLRTLTPVATHRSDRIRGRFGHRRGHLGPEHAGGPEETRSGSMDSTAGART